MHAYHVSAADAAAPSLYMGRHKAIYLSALNVLQLAGMMAERLSLYSVQNNYTVFMTHYIRAFLSFPYNYTRSLVL